MGQVENKFHTTMALVFEIEKSLVQDACSVLKKRVNDSLFCLGSKHSVGEDMDIYSAHDVSENTMTKFFMKRTQRCTPAALLLFFEAALHDVCLNNLAECRKMGENKLRIPVLFPTLYLTSSQRYYKDSSSALPARLYYNPFRLSLGKEAETNEIFDDHLSLKSVLSLACIKGHGTLQVLSLHPIDAALVTSHFLNPQINSAIKYSLVFATRNEYVLDLKQDDLDVARLNSFLRACRVYKLSNDPGIWKISSFVQQLDMPEFTEYAWKQVHYCEGQNILIPGHCTFVSFLTPKEGISIISQVLLESSTAVSSSAVEKWNDASFDCDPDVNVLDQFGKASVLSQQLRECLIGNGPLCAPEYLAMVSEPVPRSIPVKVEKKQVSGQTVKERLFLQALRQSKTLRSIGRLEEMGDFSSHIKRIKLDDKRTMLSVNFSCIIKNDH